MATYDILYGAESRIPRPGVNLLAAMPSMHIAWTTWCAYAAWSVLRERIPRGAWLVWLFPGLTAFVVLATGHHYVLDILAGFALVVIAIGGSHLLTRRRLATTAASKPAACMPQAARSREVADQDDCGEGVEGLRHDDQCAAGEAVFGPGVAQRVLGYFRTTPSTDPFPELTARDAGLGQA